MPVVPPGAPTRPKPIPFHHGVDVALRAYVVRGPRRDGDTWRWYWCVQAGGAGGEVVTKKITRDAWCTELEIEAACRAHLAEIQRSSRAGVETLGDLLEVWGGEVEKSTEGAQRTRTAKLGFCDRILGSQKSGIERDPVCAVALTDLDLPHLRALKARLLTRYASGTVHRDFKYLREAWRWGQAEGLCPPHALPQVPVAVRDTRPKPVPEEDEIPSVLLHLRGWYRVAFLLLAETGARLSEIARLRVDQIDLPRGVLRLKGKTTAEGETTFREVPLDLQGDAARELRAWLRSCEAEGPIFPGRGPDRALDQAMRHACAAAGVPVFSPGALRRRADQRLIDAGRLAEVKPLLDHSVKEAEKSYWRPSGARVRSAAQMLKVGG